MKIEMKIRSVKLMLFVFSILTVSFFPGCQKVINVDLNEAAPLIVIEGLITDMPGPYIVKISKSGSYFNQPVLPTISDAEVTITDDLGKVDTLKETSPGIYLTSKTKGFPGRTYTLKVISEDKEYSGSSTMYSHVGIDSLSLKKIQSPHYGFGGDTKVEMNVEINCFFRDPAEKNYYRIKVFANDTTGAEYYRLYDDQYSNGQAIGLRVERTTQAGNYRIELISLDKATFGYYRTLEDLLYTNPFFGSTPANPETNLNNGALGYFGACAVSVKSIIISDSLIRSLK